MKTRHKQITEASGYATVAIFSIVALVMTLIMLNTRTLAQLKGEIQLIDQRQTEFLENKSTLIYTNLPPKTV
ncbi:MAG: hypothetical protein HOI66_22545, partial [Verrucomicrobia bacterium]|nr:hypothetical protein [Verrucomicrobiota bacterium]